VAADVIPLRAPRKRRRNETRDLTQPIRAELNKIPGCRFFRNNNGIGRALHDNTPVRYGLGKGSCDLIGIVLCEAAVPGGSMGRLCALEVKWPGKKPDEDQDRWMTTIRQLGGFATVVSSPSEAAAAVVRCRMGLYD
jgi:hypothetical protein